MMRVPSHEDRIRELCAKAVAADESELKTILAELRKALREHSEFVSEIAKATLKRTALNGRHLIP
jgi:hypothetical protein